MDAAITNNGTSAVFISGPNISIDAGVTKTWSDISLADLDGNEIIKAGVVAGTIAVTTTPGPNDAALATQGALTFDALPVYEYANLPAGFNGRLAFVSDGRKSGEGAGVGTGVAAFYDATATDWLTFFDNSSVLV